jgi:hypothetical protein
MLQGLNRKPRKRLHVQYYLKTAGFDMLVIFHLLRTWIIKLYQYKKLHLLSTDASLWCDRFPGHVCRQSFACWYRKFRYIIQLRKPSNPQYDRWIRQATLIFINCFLTKDLIYKFLFFRCVVQRLSRLVFNWVRHGRLLKTFFSYMSFIGLLRSVTGQRSDISEASFPKCQNGNLEHAQKPNSRPSSNQ